MATTTTATTKPASTASRTVIATAHAPHRTTWNAAGVSSSKTTTGRTPAATSTGWAITGITNGPIATATSADTAGPTATKVAATGIGMTIAAMTATTRAKTSGANSAVA